MDELRTVGAVARQALAACARSMENHALAAQWVNSRLQEVSSQLSSLRRIGQIALPARIATGAVTLTQGSRFVTGDATALAAWTAKDFTEGGWFIRDDSSTTWYAVVDVDDNLRLILGSEFAETTATETGYQLTKHWHKLPRDFRNMSLMADPTTGFHVERTSQVVLTLEAPNRALAGAVPQRWALAEHAPDGTPRVEIYPFTEDRRQLNYVWWARQADLGLHEELPQAIEPSQLKEGVVIDVLRYAYLEETQKPSPNAEIAGLLRNDMRAQITYWEAKVRPRLLAADPGVDDATFLMQRVSRVPFQDITTARDQVWFGNASR